MPCAALRRATASRKAASTDVKDLNIPPLQVKQPIKYQIIPPDASEILAWSRDRHPVPYAAAQGAPPYLSVMRRLPFRHAAHAFSPCGVLFSPCRVFPFPMRRFVVPHGAFIDSASGRDALRPVRSTWPRRRGRNPGADLPTCQPHLLPKL